MQTAVILNDYLTVVGVIGVRSSSVVFVKTFINLWVKSGKVLPVYCLGWALVIVCVGFVVVGE